LTHTAHWEMLFHILQTFCQFYFCLMEQTLCDRQYSWTQWWPSTAEIVGQTGQPQTPLTW